MFYRAIIQVNIPEPATPSKIKETLRWIRNHAITINQGQPNEERSRITIHRCFHDENPSVPCEMLYSWQSPSS